MGLVSATLYIHTSCRGMKGLIEPHTYGDDVLNERAGLDGNSADEETR
ncbi:MAG TPA: hypothetical protein VHQ46_03035 [Desulfobacteria bacterium]|nr:hypothetical protein [Desulfobacteria bacterium]